MKIVIIAGSTRAEATSTKAAAYMARLMEEQEHRVSIFDLREHRLPIYCSDEPEGEEVKTMRETVRGADAVVLCSPEYHGSISGALKNALDYLSGEHFGGKAVLSVSSAGGAVGVSSLQHLQTIVRNVHGINCPEWISMGASQRDFDADGTPTSQDVQLRVGRTIHYFLQLAERLLD